MNLTIYVLTLFWAFICGFLLGFSFPYQKKFPIAHEKTEKEKYRDDFSVINEEYRNFLNYDGTKQQ